MKAGNIWRILAVSFCVFLGQNHLSAQTPEPTATPETNTISEIELNLIHLGDELEVEVVGRFGYNWRGTLTPEGFINGLNELEDQFFGLCREPAEVAKEITKAYSKTLNDPQVVVKIIDRSNRPHSTLYGAVKVPQRFQIKRPIHLNELIILAGGFTDKASGEIQVFRPASLNCADAAINKNQPAEIAVQTQERFISARQDNGSQFINIKINDLLSGKKEANMQILAGDIITVLESKPIYVIGGVNTPRQIATRAQMTVSRAVAAAGGLTKEGDGKRVTIFRRVGGETRIIETDLEKIKANQAEDIVLQAFDIVDVVQKGKPKRKFPPLLQIDDLSSGNAAKLPLRIID